MDQSRALEDYVGSTQAHLIGDELWAGLPAWRRENVAGCNKRNGAREISAEKAAELDARDPASRARAMEPEACRITVRRASAPES